MPELSACQPPINDADAVAIDKEARHRCQSLLSVDDTYAQIIRAVEELGQLGNTYTIVSSDHGYNLVSRLRQQWTQLPRWSGLKSRQIGQGGREQEMTFLRF